LRCTWNELFALSKISQLIPKNSESFLYGSKLDDSARGGDVDIVIFISPEISSSERWNLSITLASEYRSITDKKLDVTVLPNNVESNPATFFTDGMAMARLESVLRAPRFDHLCILVPDLVRARKRAVHFGFEILPEAYHKSEGTREFYVGEKGRPHRLLFVQPVEDGPYQRAVEKRGFGIHHFGLSTSDLSVCRQTFLSYGWNEHKARLTETAWLFKVGLPVVEVFNLEHQFYPPRHPVIEKVSLPFDVGGFPSCFVFGNSPLLTVCSKEVCVFEFV
jgi:Glyoxalase/Bleomycin resistance protein/Dioxygenase superfamily